MRENYNLGLLRISQKDYAAAVPDFKESLVLNKKHIGDKLLMALTHHNLSLCFRKSGMNESTKKHYEKAIKLYTRIGRNKFIKKLKAKEWVKIPYEL